mgnify:CR=1 FL=1
MVILLQNTIGKTIKQNSTHVIHELAFVKNERRTVKHRVLIVYRKGDIG